MTKLFTLVFTLISLCFTGIAAQSCGILSVNATPLACMGSGFLVSVNLDLDTPSSPGFTLAGNGVIYGTYLYSDLPVTVGPFLGDDDSVYDFIAWDVKNATCQQFTTLPAANCGPICGISDFELEFVACVSLQSAIVVFDFDVVNPSGLTFDLYNDAGQSLGTWLYSSLPVTLPFFEVNGAAPIILTVCDHNNAECCETFILDAIDCNPNNCEIFSVTATPQCTGNNFLVHLNFGYDNPPSDSFKVTGNSLNYGTFAYTQLPITLGPLNGNSNINWQFLIADSQQPSCSKNHVLGIYQCPPPCNVLALEAMAMECEGNEAFSLWIGLDIEGEGDTGFAVFSDSYYYGSYSYNALPVTIHNFALEGSFIDYVSICDNENLGCCSTTPFEALLCNGCLIYNLTATPMPCNQEGLVWVEIDFSHNNVSTQGFEVTGNGNNYGSFTYEQLPVLVGPFLGDGSQYFEFVVTDLVDEFCFEAVELGFISCDDICNFFDPIAETGVCTGHNQYELTLNFGYQGVGGLTFDMTVNGSFFGTFPYTSLPLTIEEFPASGNATDIITVCDHGDPECCATIVVQAPDCACSIFDLTATHLGCSSDTTFAVSVDFFYENLPGSFVDVFFDGVLQTTLQVDLLPFILQLPEGDGTGLITICANDLASCCDHAAVELLQCEAPECTIYELFAEAGDCTSASTFSVDIAFDIINHMTDSVTIFANGVEVGTYLIHPDFIRIENFPLPQTEEILITVCASNDPECCATYALVAPDCACSIQDLVVDTGECTSDSTFQLHFNFQSDNLFTDSVHLYADGEWIATSLYSGGPVMIEHFPVGENPNTVLTVCATNAPDCCATVEFETPDCSLFGLCHIWDLGVQILDCTSDTTYILHVDFLFQNLPTDSVNITLNGEFFGQYQVHPEGLYIEPFPVIDSNHTVLTICAVGDDECCAVIEFETPNCEDGGTCHLFDLIADPGECTSDSTYALFVQYFGINLLSDSVLVFANGEFVGQFPHNPDGFTIADFPAFTTNHTVVMVCAANRPDCCDVYEFETPDCNQGSGCQLFELHVEAGSCTSDSTFLAAVLFESSNLPTDSVLVYANEQLVGQYFNHPDLLLIENFPLFGTDEILVTVCALEDPFCCASFTLVSPECEGVCLISNLEYSLSHCDSSGNFYFLLTFDFANTGNDGFNVVGNGNDYGHFSYQDLPIQIGPFPTDDTVYEFLVSDVAFGDCAAAIEPGMVECLPVSVIPIPFDDYFQIVNNGNVPMVQALQDIRLTVFNANGKTMVYQHRMTNGDIYNLQHVPAGLYIATVMHGQWIWPVKLVKSEK